MGTCRGAKYLSTSVEAVEVRGEVAMAPVGGEATVLVICPYKVKDCSLFTGRFKFFHRTRLPVSYFRLRHEIMRANAAYEREILKNRPPLEDRPRWA